MIRTIISMMRTIRSDMDDDVGEDDHKKRRRTFSGEEDYIFPLNLLTEGVNRMRNTQLIVKN